ncbi:MAG: hypothetical protein HN874_03030 [Euryarchaeota archaeon]|nr:hypothetical protein [Euryarchaeota archaeon]
MARQSMALYLALLFCLMSFSPMVDASTPLRKVEVEIGLGPNGISEQFIVEVPAGEIISDFNVKVIEKSWPIDDVVSLNSEQDWANGQAMDGVDYNLTGLRILPMSHEWDFEGSAQGWTLSGGGWAHGYDSTLGATGGVHSGNSALYTYPGNYPNNMGATYWATSPTIDCSSCSGTWDLKYWKRLGIESSSYDHAYVSVKSSAGSWTNVYSNPSGTTNDGSFMQSTHDISNYINGNSAFQLRFGLGRTDGSVSYTGWNIDDITVEPRGNTGNGVANWTSLGFGPGSSGEMQMEHGLMAIDAVLPQGSFMHWSLIDENDGSLIPGFENRQDFSADLSVIDTIVHPSVQLKIQMESSSETPVINSIKLGGGIIESFEENPSTNGWSGFSSHGNGVVSGNGMLTSPQWRTTNAFSALELDWDGSGSGHFEACFLEVAHCSGNWIQIPSSGKLSMEIPSVMMNLRWSGSGSFSIDYVEIDLHRHSSPLDARIDIGLDGVDEWSFSHDQIGSWGLQNIFSNGERSSNLSISPGGSDLVSMQYPIGTSSQSYASTGPMMFSLTPLSSPLDDVEVTLSVGGKELLTTSLGLVSSPKSLILTSAQMQIIESELNSRVADFNIIDQLESHKIDVSISSTSGGDLLISGLSIPYRYTAEISGDDSLPIISAINSQLTNLNPVNGVLQVPVPIVMTNPGKLSIWDYGIQTLGSPEPIYLAMTNDSETLVAGNDWYDFSSKFDLSNIGVSDASEHFASEEWSSVFTLGGSEWSRSANCSIDSNSCNSEQGIIVDSFSHTFNGSFVEFHHRVGLSAIWPDENALIVSSSIDMDGPSSKPAQLRFGLGWSMGVEQDVEVVDWHLSFMNGAESTWDALYLDPSSPGIVEVELAFENLDSVPRSSSFNVALYQDGLLVDTTQTLNDGVASLMFTPDLLATEFDLEVTVSGLFGQNVNWKVPKNATFLPDEVYPELLYSNVAPLDHRSSDSPLELMFQIGDRPLLPRHSLLHLQTSWDGELTVQLDQPSNLNGSQGIYSKVLDVRTAEVGDTLSGWIEMFDPAGHALPNSGSQDSPLFIIRFGPDGAPIVLDDGLGWTQQETWLHPGQNYSMEIPIQDVNGYGDLQSVEIDMSSESSENLLIHWSNSDGCSTTNDGILIQNCVILGDTSHFDSVFTLQVVMSFDWIFNPDSSLERRIRVSAIDDSGQSHRSDLEATWRYSSEIEIDVSSVSFTDSTAFVAPGQNRSISADLVWTKGGQPVDYPIEVAASIEDNEQYGMSINGTTNLHLVAPNSTGIHPITMDLVNLPPGAIDRTNSDEVVAWMVVDGDKPKVLQLLSPDPLELVEERDWENLTFEIMVNESEGLSLDSMRMHWLIVPHGITIPELALLSGNVSMDLIAGTGAGESIPLAATLNVATLIPEVSRHNSWDLWVWVEGHDYASHYLDSTFNSMSSPLAVLQLANRQSDIQISSDDIIMANQYPSVNTPVMLNITVHNYGQVDGTSSVRVEVIEDGKNRRLLEIINVDVPASSSVYFELSWVPESPGTAWVEVSTPGGVSERTDAIQVEKGESTFIIEGLDGASNSMLTGFAIITFMMLGLLGYLVVSGKKDSNEEYDESDYI